jgi:hypothetical protein
MALSWMKPRANVASDNMLMLGFPNLTRSYDSARQAVRFWGHDRSMEAAFIVTADALQRMQPGAARDEAGLLAAFDRHRGVIHLVAAKAYERSRKASYALDADSF